MPALLKTTQIQEPSSATVNLTLGTDGTMTTGTNMTVTGTAVMSSPYTMRNKIINGAMVIDQRNAGAAITINSTTAAYVVDRWRFKGESTDGVFTVQQSTTAPTGYTNSTLITVTTADASLGASQHYVFNQFIEGFNVADFGFGAAGASTITLSFWVRSSVTGTFGGSLQNSAENRSYPFTYTINAANTFEQKTITITGDTTGTWVTNNGIGLRVTWGLGVGSTLSGTAGAWAAADYRSATGATNLMATLNATMYITGVQLERGTVATPFEYRNYQQELAMCQRYFITTRLGNPNNPVYITDVAISTSRIAAGFQFPVVMRTDPTTTIYSCAADTSGAVTAYNGTSAAIGSTFAASNSNQQGIFTYVGGSASLTAGNFYSYSYTANAEL